MATIAKSLVITGTDKVLRNLNREIMGIRSRSKAGLREAALVIRRRSMELTPVDTGNLRGSAYTETFDGVEGPGAEIGYTAGYAVYVHEIDKSYTVGQWKFLETALKEKSHEILEIIRKRVHVGLGR